jgi:hypothetical protein
MISTPALWIDPDAQAQITFELGQRVPDWLDASARLNPLPDRRLFRHSFFLSYRVTTDAGPVTILVKIARKPSIQRINAAIRVDELRKIAQQEYAFLKTTWEAFKRAKKPGFRAVQPFAYLEAWNAIVMRKAEGESLNQLFYRPAIPVGLPGGRQKLLAVLKQAGQWLKLFHQYAGEMRLEPFPRAEAEKELERLLDSLSTNSANQLDVRGFKKGLLELLSQLNGEVPVARLHGDYHFSNILFTSDGQICALDPFYSLRNPVYEDLAELLVHPETRPVQVFSGGQFAPPQFVADCRKAVMDGYFDDSSFDRKMLEFYCALHILHQWSMNEKRLQKTGVKQTWLKPVVMLTRGYFDRLLAQYLPAAV